MRELATKSRVPAGYGGVTGNPLHPCVLREGWAGRLAEADGILWNRLAFCRGSRVGWKDLGFAGGSPPATVMDESRDTMRKPCRGCGTNVLASHRGDRSGFGRSLCNFVRVIHDKMLALRAKTDAVQTFAA